MVLDAGGHRLGGPYHYPALQLPPFNDQIYDQYLAVEGWYVETSVRQRFGCPCALAPSLPSS